MVRWLTLLLTSSFILLGCDRPVDGKSSRITIQAPAAYGKAGALSTPANRKACYGVSITGEGVGSVPAATCSPQMGQVIGFVEAGQVIQAAVDRGSDRKIELYVFLKAAGDNTACPVMTKGFSASQLLNTYLVGTVPKVDFNGDEVVVEINATFPGEGNHLAAQMAMPASCTAIAGGGSLPGFSVSTGVQTVTGTGLILKARVGKPSGGQVLTGGGMNLRVK